MSRTQQIVWCDGERIYSRVKRLGKECTGILVVRPAAEQPLPATLHRMACEYSLKDELNSAWALRPLALEQEEGQTRLLLDDPGGVPLSQLLLAPLEIEVCLCMAVEIASALGHLHQRDLVHKDLKPGHIIVNCADGKARLTGFGLTSRLPRERQAPEPPETIAGTLAYMAPEQTGRMNRSIDSRSDLYAFGITLYQMLTGSLPFSANSPMEWVHCHIARKALPPCERAPSVPAMLSQIVIKLLAKTAEERYQSATGVENDLRRCLDEWRRKRHVNDFVMDQHGTHNRLLIPEKLYGREQEVDTLVEAFGRVVKNSTSELVLVSGYSGIGKSSVINELHKVLVPPRGLFASGKFDQYKRDIPYSTLVQAFQGLVRPLLGKNDAELARWREALLEALELNARLMTDLIPELKLIIGEPLPVPELEVQQAQRRFLLVFRRFIGVFARAEHPLALFLDDLQWLDAATLDLLEDLLTSVDLRHLMVIGAYRDNEVDDLHPLMVKLRALRSAGVKINEIKLAPLTTSHVRLLLAEALLGGAERIESLARLVHDKTAGNPFFVVQFLQALVSGQLLTFEHGPGQWAWDPERIHAKGYTDNVVDLMVDRLSRLPDETQLALQQLACLGNAAGISTLAWVLDIARARVQSVLWEAIRQELVERQGESYSFVHDRIHEAAYSLLPERARAEAHLRIGRLLAARTPPLQRDEASFEIVGQLNRGSGLMTEVTEREELAAFNLLAGRRAKESTAYATALAYLVTGGELLGDNPRQDQLALRFELELNRAECEFLTGQLAVADQRLEALANRVDTTVERARVACLHMDVCLLLNQSRRAIEVYLEYLRHVGIEWSFNPSDEDVREEYERIHTGLAGRDIGQLLDLPLMDDAASLATVEVLIKIFAPALHTIPNLACLTICKAINLSIEYGSSDASCVAYSIIPKISGPRFGDYEQGNDFGRLACDLVERRGLKRYEARTYLYFSVFAATWIQPVMMCLDQMRGAFAKAERIGDLPFAAFAYKSIISNQLFAGQLLAELQGEVELGLTYARKVRFGLVISLMEDQLALIRTLRGLTPVFGLFDDEQYKEAQVEQRMTGMSLALTCWHWIIKLQARYLAGQYEAALEAAAKAQPLLKVSNAFIEEAEYYFFAALATAAVCDGISADARSRHLQTLAEHQSMLLTWADLCPENFACRSALVGAEIARLEGRILEAERLYGLAMKSAQKNNFLQIEALANELASRFYRARDLDKIAQLYLQDARYGYLRWGACGKVRELDAENPSLRTDEPAPNPTSTMVTPVEHLDLATVIKLSQAVSGEIVLDRLIAIIMRTAIEQTGAERGLLILTDSGTPCIAAEATAAGEATQLQLRDTVVHSAMLPESILYQVLRTRESVVLDDATATSAFAVDPYIIRQRARSVICLPLMNQAKLIGALYLENTLAARVFSSTRIAVLKLVASQAAISLENARLYREVAEREAKIRRLVDANIIGIVFWNADGEIVEANDAFLRMLGYDRDDVVSGRLSWREMTAPEYRELSENSMMEAVQTGHAQPFEKEYFKKDGSRLPVILGLAMFEDCRKEGVAFVLDLTGRKQAEEKIRDSEQRYREVQVELAHANRVATMGQLAASIAHEVSQPIAATLMNSHAALRWLGTQPPQLDEVRQSLELLIKDANRAADVMDRIRGHIRKAPPKKERLDINCTVREMIEFTRGEVTKSGATVQILLADNLPNIEGDRIELHQVLLNLIINALDAMSVVPQGSRELHICSQLDDAGCVQVSVSDSGPGFVTQSPEQIFAAFYTTKTTGLGMGLSICRSIIEAYGGRLWASENRPRGAVIHLSLPSCSK